MLTELSGASLHYIPEGIPCAETLNLESPAAVQSAEEQCYGNKAEKVVSL